MDNVNTKDIENFEQKMEDKYSDRDSEKMGYQEFKKEFGELVEKGFNYKGIRDVEIDNRIVDKINESYDAFTVKRTGTDVGVNVNVTEAYEAYVNNDVSMKGIAAEMVTKTAAALDNVPAISNYLDDFKNYDAMKSRLVMEVISAETNAELLTTVPHKDIEDLAVVYRFDVHDIVSDGATKDAARCSLFIIFLSQLTSLFTTLITCTVPSVNPMLLLSMVVMGVAGGAAGRRINDMINQRAVDVLFLSLLLVIMGITLYNCGHNASLLTAMTRPHGSVN